MNVDTLYDIIIEYLTKAYALYIGKWAFNPRKIKHWRLQLYNVQSCKEHYNLRWEETDVNHAYLPWNHSIDIYSWLVYGKMYS